MADHITEEEQIEALKNWWSHYGNRVLVVFGTIFVGFFLWQYIDQQQKNRAEGASEIYARLTEELSRHGTGEITSQDAIQNISEIAESINKEYQDTFYSQLAALTNARMDVEQDELDAAAEELGAVMENRAGERDFVIIRLRLSRVESARGKIEDALNLVQGIDTGFYKSLYEEAKGDFYLLRGNRAAAYSAFQSALDSNESRDNISTAVLQMKLRGVSDIINIKPDSSSVEQSVLMKELPSESVISQEVGG